MEGEPAPPLPLFCSGLRLFFSPFPSFGPPIFDTALPTPIKDWALPTPIKDWALFFAASPTHKVGSFYLPTKWGLFISPQSGEAKAKKGWLIFCLFCLLFAFFAYFFAKQKRQKSKQKRQIQSKAKGTNQSKKGKVGSRRPPSFSPIFDTALPLFCSAPFLLCKKDPTSGEIKRTQSKIGEGIGEPAPPPALSIYYPSPSTIKDCVGVLHLFRLRRSPIKDWVLFIPSAPTGFPLPSPNL